jgi:cbb3-type cytochrome oxidase maturation protein
MSLSTLALIFLSLCVGAGVWLVFLWAVRRGEFDDPEGPKYRMLHDDDDSAPGDGTGSESDRHEQP